MQPASKETRPKDPPKKRPPRAFVVRDPAPEEVGAKVDWSSWYLTDEEDMGHSPEHSEVMMAFCALTITRLREMGRDDLRVGFDEFFAWVEGEPLVRVSPDVIVHVAPPPPYPDSWATYRGHAPPLFALEAVSQDWRKDYEDNPAKYAQLGCRELVIFDPQAARGVTRVEQRKPLQVYRRDEDGAFVRTYEGPGPAFSEVLGAWLVAVGDRPVAQLRIARDEGGRDLVPFAEDLALQARLQAAADHTRAEQERARAEQERARAEQEHARAEDEKQRRLKSEQENEELRAELGHLRGSH